MNDSVADEPLVDPERKVIVETESKRMALARAWPGRLRESLQGDMDSAQADRLYLRYADAFSLSYCEDFSSVTAVSDIGYFESLSASQPLAVAFYQPLDDAPGTLRFKLFQQGENVQLSDVLPMLENLGLRVLAGRPYRISPKENDSIWIYDFAVQDEAGKTIDLDKTKRPFEDAFIQIWQSNAENDSFNHLVISAELRWREVALLRAYARYFKQTGFAFSQDYIKDALKHHPAITRLLIAYFSARFDPAVAQDEAVVEALHSQILSSLEQVASLDEDRILRRYLDMMVGTLRTSFYQQDAQGQFKTHISFKLSPHDIPDLPKPLPRYEIYVYSPRVEGVHLRGGKVARGGLRWSDRREDFRTEVLGLVKAQQVKNAVIVPVGAKGGFVPRNLPKEGGRDAQQAEAVACYQIFIRGLLDITDNLVDGKIQPPPQVVRKDGDDPYLVVAADKGTASFSDTANALSSEYDFWLGDAFASGGSQGYDHKKMGITARGAWISVQRHFRELGIDVQSQPVTLIGIGDMSGDVFGNGLLRSRSVKLVAAFNHQHIFIDPDPDLAASFAERERLFHLPRSGWDDYAPTLISEGGGVFQRSAKSIKITLPMQQLFDIQVDSLTPAELISALLKAPVDLIWNGGIGTYIKSSRETHVDVGDKGNDAVRVDGRDVRARVIGEGGNLGMTQLGRIEYTLNGGLCNTDFIDNAGGVDCSDHEVNIKILLNEALRCGELTLPERNPLLADMTDEVARLVLRNNYRQTQAISIARSESVYRMGEFRRYIQMLTASGKLDRTLEFIPADDELHERLVNGKGLMRPELAILLSYTKSVLKDELLASDLPDDEFVSREVEKAFPAILAERFGNAMNQHKLRREIVATQVASALVDSMGITFVFRMRDSTGASTADIARSFLAAREILELDRWWKQIEALDSLVSSQEQLDMMRRLIRLMRRITRWFLRNHRCGLSISEAIARFQPGIKAMLEHLPAILPEQRRNAWEIHHGHWLAEAVPAALATYVASVDSLMPVMGIIQAAEKTGKPVAEVADVYFAMGSRLDLYWFGEQINDLQIDNHWQALAREAYRDDLEWQQRTLTVGVLQMDGDATPEERIARWADHHQLMITRWENMLTELRTTDVKEFSMYGVALRELLDLAQATLHDDFCMD